MKLLFENWRNFTQTLLNEVSFEQAKNDSLYGKATEKMLKGYLYDLPGEGMPDFFQRLKAGDENIVKAYNVLLNDLRKYLLALVPADIPEDSQKGQALLWVIRVFKRDPNLTRSVMMIGISDPAGQSTADQFLRIKKNLEIFFQQHRFMPVSDLTKIESPEQLEYVIEAARPAIQAAQEKEQKTKVEEGTEFFRGDFLRDENGVPIQKEIVCDRKGTTQNVYQFKPHKGWVIAAIHTPGAAKELGKSTEWCFAAPGVGEKYFDQYYSKDDPIFFFRNERNGKRFAFSYGTSQFMDVDDVPLEDEQINQLHSLLKQTKAFEKYDVIRAHDDLVIARTSKDPQELEELAERYAENITAAGIDVKQELMSNPAATDKVYRILFEKDKTGPTRKALALHARDHEILMSLANPESYDLGPRRAQWTEHDPQVFGSVMYRLLRNPNVSEEVIDKILNTATLGNVGSHLTVSAMRRMVDIEKTFLEGNYDLGQMWPGLRGEQILKIAKATADRDGADSYVFRTLIYLIQEDDIRYIEEDNLMRKVLTIGASATDPAIREAVARYEETPLDILEKIASEQLSLSVQSALVKNRNTSDEILNKIIDRGDNRMILRDIAFRGIPWSPGTVTRPEGSAAKHIQDRKGPVPSEAILLRLLLLHQDNPEAWQWSAGKRTSLVTSAQRLVKAAATALKHNYDYSIKDLAKLLGEEYKEAVKEANPRMGDDWANYLFDSHPRGDVFESRKRKLKENKKIRLRIKRRSKTI